MCTSRIIRSIGQVVHLTVMLVLIGGSQAWAAIPGITGTNFNFTAKTNHIYGADGLSFQIWGFAHEAGPAQYPGPTMIINQGDTVTVNVTNELAEPVSMIFPGQGDVAAAEVSPLTQTGLVTLEALPGGTVSYTFTAPEPGTYYYQSGTNMDKQCQMGLFGALIVRPAAPFNDGKHAYNHEDSQYDREILLLLSEMDVNHQEMVEFGEPIDTTTFWPVYWFINGRNAPDTMAMPGVPWLPAQPYNCMPRINPGDRLLMRFIGMSRDVHPFHTHGNHMRLIARDGRLLSSDPGVTGADLSIEIFGNSVAPGTTSDAIFTWTGEGLGWDIYGPIEIGCVDADNDGYDDGSGDPCHDATCTDGDSDHFDDATHEYCPDHGDPMPVILPEGLELTFGGFYSGSPFLGAGEALPPGEGGLNPNGGFTYMWHSHKEKEMVNNDIFPGGLMTMLIVEPWWVEIPE